MKSDAILDEPVRVAVGENGLQRTRIAMDCPGFSERCRLRWHSHSPERRPSPGFGRSPWLWPPEPCPWPQQACGPGRCSWHSWGVPGATHFQAPGLPSRRQPPWVLRCVALGAQADQVVELGGPVVAEVDAAVVDLEPEALATPGPRTGAVAHDEGRLDGRRHVAGELGHGLDVEPLADDIAQAGLLRGARWRPRPTPGRCPRSHRARRLRSCPGARRRRR